MPLLAVDMEEIPWFQLWEGTHLFLGGRGGVAFQAQISKSISGAGVVLGVTPNDYSKQGQL